MAKLATFGLLSWVLMVDSRTDANSNECRIGALLPLSGSHSRAFSYIATVSLAIDHFNSRSGDVVPELSNLPKACNTTIPAMPLLDLIDTNGDELSSTTFLNQELGRKYESGRDTCNASSATSTSSTGYCGLVGVLSEKSDESLELSVLARALKVPVVLAGGYLVRFVTPGGSPFTSRTTPQSLALFQAVTFNLIQTHKRNNFIAIVYPLSDSGVQLMEGAQLVFDEYGIRNKKFPYAEASNAEAHGKIGGFASDSDSGRSVISALDMVKESGYRTILWVVDQVLPDLPRMVPGAQQIGLTNGDYFWIHAGNSYSFETLEANAEEILERYRTTLGSPAFAKFYDNSIDNQTLREQWRREMKDFLHGSAIVKPADGFIIEPETDRFLKAWQNLNATYVEKLREGLEGFDDSIQDDFFQVNKFPPSGASFLYDAVVSMGMGACMVPQSNATSARLVESIWDSVFVGASGDVRFREYDVFLGSRATKGTLFAAYNTQVKEDDDDEKYEQVLTGVLDNRQYPTNSVWQSIAPFTYADGSNSPPALLRDVPDQNYISNPVVSVGYVLFGVGWSLLVFFCVWIWVYRTHKVVKAAQPLFLIMVHVGSAAILANIIPLSLQENGGWTQRQLDMACTSSPWLFSIGWVVTYMALFSKLYRINKVLQFRRTAVSVKQALWPFRIVVGFYVVLYILWTVLDGSHYERREINSDTGASHGVCIADNFLPWTIPNLTILTAVTIMTIYIAWQTKDVDAAYAESAWIFTALSTQVNILIVCIPTLVLLTGVSSDGRYLGITLSSFCLTMSISCLIMVPKFKSVHFGSSDATTSDHRSRGGGGRGNVNVTGISNSMSTPERSVRLQHSNYFEETAMSGNND